MKKRIISLVIVAFVAGSVATAQQKESTIKFDETVHDFGDVPQKGGPVTHSFEFTNTGSEPLIIQNVKASCGCTTPGWTKEPVAPGEKGFVKATYMPSGATPFDKSLTVTSAGNPNVVLRIRGKVVAKELTVEELFPVAYGSLRLRAGQLDMKQMMQGITRVDSVGIINTGADAVKLSFAGAPPQVHVEAVPATLKAGEKGSIRVTYNTSKKKEWGSVSYPVAIKINGKEQKNAQITVTGTIAEDFSKLTPAELEQAPIALFSPALVNFGEVKLGTSYTGEYEITNIGKEKLIIHRAAADNAHVKVSAPSAIKPGGKEKIKVVLDTKNETVGTKTYFINFITNSPRQSNVSLKLTGKISN